MGKKRTLKKKVVRVCIGEKILVEHRCKTWITIKECWLLRRLTKFKIKQLMLNIRKIA